MICASCGRAFEAKRSHARFCSPRCRLVAHRSRDPFHETHETHETHHEGERELQRVIRAVGKMFSDDEDRLIIAKALCQLSQRRSRGGVP